MSNYSYKILDLFDTKNKIKSAIENKGVTVGDNIIFKDYAKLINKIETGGGGDVDEYALGLNALTLETYCGNKVDSMYRAFQRHMSVGDSFMFYPQHIIGGEIGDSVTDAQYAYHNCISLEHANVHSTVLTDMNYTFTRCNNLKYGPYIPNTVKYMQNTFQLCTNMTGDVYMPIMSEQNVFAFRTYDSCYNITGCPMMQNRDIASQMNIGNASYLFNACYNLQGNYYIPNTVFNLARMFLNCGNISHIVVPELRKTITATQFVNAFLKNESQAATRLNVWVENYTQFTYAAKNAVAVNMLPTLTAETGSLEIDGNLYPYNNYVYSEISNVYIYGP